ncbi:MAG TPA: translation initiation factor IF-3 [Thermoanaerobaculia bacterium]|nr:translation initiation factor IF-3 [Thermoanaerobaculia bacterium]
MSKPTEPRINNRIRKSPLRLIAEDGEQLGIVTLDDARQRAEDQGLDLVEVGPDADPPVVRLMDYGKMRYEKQKREREARKKTHTIEIKEVKYRPTIDQHDRDRKTTLARTFLQQGNKVKVTIFFRYRQLRRPELGQEILDQVQRELEDVGKVEFRSRGMEGRQMTMVLNPIEEPKAKTS